LLNLFGYTGAASLVAHAAGFDVTHVDASRTTLGWVKENLVASGLPDDSLRLILDDAFAFARREVRRGNTYAGILLDPPHYGRGPKGEKWQLEDKLAELLAAVGQLLEPRSFCILSTYAVGYSPLAFQNMFAELFPGEAGVGLEAGELVLPEQGGRLLPCGYCARLTRGGPAPG
jgi:23S rRNA (cytosine1962-C5)-methyltransferase